MNVLAILGILLSLLLLIYLAYKGWCVIAIAPLVSLVAVIIGAIAYGESPHLLAHYTETFMTAAGSYIKNYFPIFMLGAVFGKMLELSGAAQSIANTLTDKLGEKEFLHMEAYPFLLLFLPFIRLEHVFLGELAFQKDFCPVLLH